MQAIAEFYGPRMNDDWLQVTCGMVAVFSDNTCPSDDSESENSETVDQNAWDVKPYEPATYYDRTLWSALVQFFLSFSCVDAASFPGNSLLIVAAKTRNNELLKGLISLKKVDPNATDANGDTALLWCIRKTPRNQNSNCEGIKLLISHEKTNVNHRNKSGKTAFLLAVDLFDMETLILLVASRGFDADKSDVVQGLAWAIEQDQSDIVSFILSLAFDINSRVYFERASKRKTVLKAAIAKRDLALIRAISQHKRFDRVEHGLADYLFEAASRDDLEMFRVLLGLYPGWESVRNDEGDSLFAFACLNGQIGIIKQILSSPGFSVSRSQGSRALAACIKGGHSSLIPFIAGIPGVDVNANFPRFVNDVPARVPPVLAALLMKNTTQTRYEVNRLGHMIRTSQVEETWAFRECFRVLVSLPSVNLNTCGEDSDPLLCEACKIGLGSCILEQEGRYDINIRDVRGQTALMYAINHRHWDDSKALIRKGIDLSLKDWSGKTAWEMVHLKNSIVPPAEPVDRDEYATAVCKLLSCDHSSPFVGIWTGLGSSS
jgi:ankyrin repeat protein